MIEGFEDLTKPLTDDEKRLAVVVGRILKEATGPITNGDLRRRAAADPAGRGQRPSETRLREIIHYLRVTGKVRNLVASSSGYEIATDPEAIRKYLAGLEHRVTAIQAAHDALYEQYLEDFRSLELFAGGDL